MAYTVRTEGAVSAKPPSGAEIPSGSFDYAFAVPEQFTVVNPIPLSLSNVTDQVVALGMASCKRLYIRCTASLSFKVTTATETDQIVRCNGLMILGDNTKPITGLKVTGTADGEILACGD